MLSPAQLVERLRDRFALLAGARARHAKRRSETRSTGPGSCWLPWEQAALAQCSVFEGGFTLDAAEAVLDLSAWPEAPAIVDAVQALVDKSLLRTWVPVEQTRHDFEEPYFGMYLSLHEYARRSSSRAAPTGNARRRNGMASTSLASAPTNTC